MSDEKTEGGDRIISSDSIQSPKTIGIHSSTQHGVTTPDLFAGLKGLSIDSFKDVLDPKLLENLQEVLPKVVEKINSFETVLKNDQVKKYQNDYEILEKKRKYEGKQVPPPLQTIVDNFYCLSDTRRTQKATDLIREEFALEDGVANLYENPDLLADFKKIILKVHQISVENNLELFQLDDHPQLMEEGIRQMRDFFSNIDVKKDVSDSIYERLADYGYLGTAEKIKEIKTKLQKLENKLDIYWDAQERAMYGGFVGVIIGLVVSMLPLIVMYPKGLGKENIPMTALVMFISMLATFLGITALVDEGENAWNVVTYPLNKPKQFFLKKKLEKLEGRDKKITTIEKLAKDLAGSDDVYSDRDSMDDEKINKVYQDFINIRTLLSRFAELGHEYSFEKLNLLSSEELDQYVKRVESYDKELIKKKIEAMKTTLGGFASEDVATITDKALEAVMKQYNITLPSHVIAIEQPVNHLAVIDKLDKIIEAGEFSVEDKKKYNKLKDTVQASRKIEDLEALQQLMKGYIESAYTNNYEKTREKLIVQLRDLGITEETNGTVFRDILEIVLQKHPYYKDQNKPLQLPSGVDEDILDLNFDGFGDLDKLIKLKQKEKLGRKD